MLLWTVLRKRTVLAMSQVYDKVPEGTAYLAMTMEQAGINGAVRMARHTITTDATGEKKSVAIKVQLVQGAGAAGALQPAATGGMLNPPN